MEIEFKKADDSDFDFLINLRNLTMLDQLEKAGITLSEQENLIRVKSYFENAFIVFQSNTKAGMIKYIETDSFSFFSKSVSPIIKGLFRNIGFS